VSVHQDRKAVNLRVFLDSTGSFGVTGRGEYRGDQAPAFDPERRDWRQGRWHFDGDAPS
jgi:hypothetical protein